MLLFFVVVRVVFFNLNTKKKMHKQGIVTPFNKKGINGAQFWEQNWLSEMRQKLVRVRRQKLGS